MRASHNNRDACELAARPLLLERWPSIRVLAESSFRTSNAASRSSLRLLRPPGGSSRGMRYCLTKLPRPAASTACECSLWGPLGLRSSKARAATGLQRQPYFSLASGASARAAAAHYSCARCHPLYPYITRANAPSTRPGAQLVCRINNLSTSIVYDCITLLPIRGTHVNYRQWRSQGGGQPGIPPPGPSASFR